MTAFVLGNGQSRSVVDPDFLLKKGHVYGCNGLYRTHTPTVLVATDRPIAEAIQNSGYSRNNRFYTRRPIEGLGAQKVPKAYFGFSSGPIATALAALDGHRQIYMLGFDMGPAANGRFNNVYADTEFYKRSDAQPTFTGNWQRQIMTVARDFPNTEFFRMHGPTTAAVKEFDSISNLKKMDIADFVALINTAKDL